MKPIVNVAKIRCSGFMLALSLVFLDQLTKLWAMTHLLPYQSRPLFPNVNLTLAFNTGSAFSFLATSGPWHSWFFLGFGLLMCLALSVWLWWCAKEGLIRSLCIGLLLGGALGNMVDRLRWGHVIDFIDCYIDQYHWPVFNVADSAICMAAIMLALRTCLQSLPRLGKKL